MAGIDKMHLTRDQLYKFYEWFFNHYNINKQGQDMLESVTYRDDSKTIDNIYATFNFSTRTDNYLRKHCKLKFIQKRLDEQYGKA